MDVVEAAMATIRKFAQNGNKDCINEYWKDRPQRILGELNLKLVNSYGRHAPTCMAQDSQKVLRCLANCKFDQATKDNFNKIAGNLPVTVNISNKLQLLKKQLLGLTNTNLRNINSEINNLLA